MFLRFVDWLGELLILWYLGYSVEFSYTWRVCQVGIQKGEMEQAMDEPSGTLLMALKAQSCGFTSFNFSETQT